MNDSRKDSELSSFKCKANGNYSPPKYSKGNTARHMSEALVSNKVSMSAAQVMDCNTPKEHLNLCLTDFDKSMDF